jgi:hypothetical protein
MASFKNPAGTASAPKLILPITGGSCSEPANKKQKKEAQRRVQHVGVQGPFIKSRWSHIQMLWIKLEKYLDTVRRIEASFEGFSVKNIPRGENEYADLLAKLAAQGLPLASEVFFETIKAPSVELLERAVLNISLVYSEDWRTEIISFLQGNFFQMTKLITGG